MAAAAGAAAPVVTPPRRRVVVLLATAFALNSLVSTGVLAQITLLLGATGLTAAQAVGMAALVGPMQVVGRVMELTFAKHVTPVRLATLALAALPAAFAAVVFGARGVAAGALFVVLLGLSNGVMTIVRGVVPATLFGRERLATVLGLLGAPTLAARAAAPLGISILIATLADMRYVFAALAVVAAAAVVAFRLIPKAVSSAQLPVQNQSMKL
jgi:MFS family permease